MSYPTENEIIDLDEINGKPWDKHPDESSKNYNAFCAFRDLGRNRDKLQAYLNYTGKSREEWGKSQASSQFYAWAKKYKWNERAEAWDEKQEKKKREEMEEEMVEYSKTMMKNSQIVGDSVLKGLKSRLEGKDPEEIEDLIFSDDGLSLEGVSRTLATIKSVASEAYGQLSEEDKNDEADTVLKVIDEATSEE